MHNVNKLAHLDLKPDNIVINDDFTLSLIDFGHTNRVDAQLDVVTGTDSYMPPEIRHLKRQQGASAYAADKADMFALGITLFILMFNSVPFGKAELSDSYYKPLGMRNSDLFFKQHPSTSRLAKRNKLEFSLMHLLTSMMDPEAARRPSIAQVYEFSWMAGSSSQLTPTLQKEMQAYLL